MSGERRWRIYKAPGQLVDILPTGDAAPGHGGCVEGPDTDSEWIEVMPASDHLARIKELEAEPDHLRARLNTREAELSGARDATKLWQQRAEEAERVVSSLRSKVEQAVSKLREDPRNQEPREVAAMLERVILDETGGGE